MLSGHFFLTILMFVVGGYPKLVVTEMCLHGGAVCMVTSPSVIRVRDSSQTDTSGGARGWSEQNRFPEAKASKLALFVGEKV